MGLEKTLPLVAIFLAGYLLKRAGVLKREDAGTLFQLLAYLVVPAAIVSSFTKVRLSLDLASLPLIAVGITSVLLGLGFLIAKGLGLTGARRGAFIISFPSLEGGTIGYAFMFAAFGELGLSRIVLFDFGNALWEFTVLYFIAILLGQEAQDRRGAVGRAVRQILKNPFLWAEVVGIALNIAHVENLYLDNFLGYLAAPLPIVAMLFLALKFELAKADFRLPIITVVLKLAAGLGLGALAVHLFGLTGMERMAVLVGATLPTSIMAILFAERAKLDTNYVASLLALAIPIDLAVVTVLRSLF